MTEEEPYTNLDLDTAEELLIAAGKKELAVALRYQAQGVRNLVQGTWGQSFVNSLETIMDTRVVSVLASVQSRLDEQYGMVQQLLAMQKASDKNAKRALAVAKETGLGLKKLSGEVVALSSAMAESKADRADLRERIDALTADRVEIAQIQRELAELQAWRQAQERGDGQ